MPNQFIVMPPEGDSRTVSIVIPVEKTIEQIVEELPEGSVFSFIDKSDIPTTRFFRDCWAFPFEKENYAVESIYVDMDKARLQVQEMIRVEREPAFQKLDVAYMRASEAKDEAEMQAIAELKQILRDLPSDPRIEAAKTPEELEHLARNSVSKAVGV
ncbi:MAG: hypothetical protein ISR34_08200 [Pirellulales bacterium]|nr:hypothetical protein [Pirellulales bacterium]